MHLLKVTKHLPSRRSPQELKDAEAAALQPFPGIYWSTVCSQLLLLHPLPQHSKPVLCVCDLDPFRLFFKENSIGQVSASDTIPMKNVTSHNFSLWLYEHENIKHSVKYNNQKQMSKTSNILISGLLPQFQYQAGDWQLPQCCP